MAVPIVLAASVLIALALKPEREVPATPTAVPTPIASHATSMVAPQTTGIPRLVDLGADQCIPCKAMAPILVELRNEYAGRMQVDFIDVWKNPGAERPYNIYASVLLIAAYGVGHCSLIVVAGASTSWVGRYLRWTDRSRGAAYLRYASGALVLLGGVYLIYTA